MGLRDLLRLLRFGSRRPLAAREAYALWADTYPPRPHNALMEAEQAVTAPLIQSLTPARALDVGTGSGRYLPILASTGASVVGLDFSLPMLTHSEPRVLPATAPRVCADACRLPFGDATFDLVTSSLMAGDIADLDAWLREVTRVLAPAGHLVYSDFHPSWTTERWRRTFRAGNGRPVEIEYFPHSIADHLVRLERTFDVRAILEPRVSHDTVQGTRIAGVPVVVVFHAVKHGRRRHEVVDSRRALGSCE